uniref:Variant surface glycoprotein 1125.4819 n=1 Tax=Trypanosoma brucei TaxID=5691 RepID=A0A1J0RAS5_9TRYP|nr:variant surface glycoprotein 1125.4819 [Trypanosoma brucei]
MLKATAATVFLTVLIALSVTAFHETEKNTKTACDAAENFEKMTQQISASVETQQSQVQKANVILARLSVAAQINNGRLRQLLLPVISAATARTAAAQKELDAALPPLMAATKTLSRIHGMQHLIADVAKLQVEAVNAGAIAGTITTNGKPIQYATFGSGKGACSEDSQPKRGTDNPVKAGAHGPKITVAVLQRHTPTPATATAGPRCCVGASLTDNSCGGADTTATQFGMSTGAMLTEKLETFERQATDDLDYKQTAMGSKDLLTSKSYISDALKGLKTTEALIAKLSFKADEPLSATIVEEKAFERTILSSIDGQAKESAKGKHTDEIERIKKSVYGKADNSFDKKIWTTVNSITLEPQATSADKGEKLSEINDLDKLGSALAYYMAKKEATSTPTQECVSQKETNDCGGIKDKTQCDAKDGCKYNEKESKCEEDPAKATATAATNTNTT